MKVTDDRRAAFRQLLGYLASDCYTCRNDDDWNLGVVYRSGDYWHAYGAPDRRFEDDGNGPPATAQTIALALAKHCVRKRSAGSFAFHWNE